MMEYREFNPKQILGMNTGAVSITMNMINSHSRAWLTQAEYVLLENCCQALNSFYHGVRNTVSDDFRRKLDQREAGLREFCNTVICLGADGNIYMIVYLEKNPSKQEIFQCSYFSQSLLNEQYCNVYNGVLGGALGALDAIPLDRNDQLRDVHLLLDDDYYYNFPVELDDEKYPFGFLGGTYYRVILLLTKEEREKCFAENEWIHKKFA